MRFGVRDEKVEVFRSAKPHENLNPTDATNGFLEEVKIDGRTRSIEP